MNASSPKILTVDDSKTVRRILAGLFAPFGCSICEAANGEEGLAVAALEKPDLILLDYNMPVMDGLSATREIRLNEAAMGLGRTPIVMLTANALADHIAAAEAAGADRHLAKPFDAAELLELISTLPRPGAVSEAA